MKITEITISAGQTFNHPYESYSNFRPQITLKATVGPEDDPIGVARELQARAEFLVREHRELIIKQLLEVREMLEKIDGQKKIDDDADDDDQS
jgi:hypothetical protein